MKRILMMVLRNLLMVPYAWIRLCYRAAHVDKYTEEDMYAFLKWIDLHANRGGNVHIDVHGAGNLPEKNGFMFFPNHQGLYDVLAIIEASPRPFSVVAKKEIANIPFLKQVFANMASRGGEGLSGAQLRISADGKLLDARVGGKPMQDEALYTVSTIDFLAEGNDGLTALRQAQQRQCPPNAVLRDVFMDYVKRETAAGRPLTARIEGRIIVEY